MTGKTSGAVVGGEYPITWFCVNLGRLGLAEKKFSASYRSAIVIALRPSCLIAAALHACPQTVNLATTG
jgi:hypothetical protein